MKKNKKYQTAKKHPVGKKEFKKAQNLKEPVQAKPFNRKNFIYIAIIIVLTTIVYFPAFNNDFTNWDDTGYILKNETIQEINFETIKELFSRYDMGNYHPFTMISLAVDYSLSDFNPPEKPGDDPKIKASVFHFVNIIIHLLNTLVVFILIYRLMNLFQKKRRFVPGKMSLETQSFIIAAITSFLFGIHTLHVESVAWISERKDVLYTLFFLASLLLYLSYLKHKKTGYFILSILLFIFSLLSKGQAVTLTVTLIVIDFFLGRKLLSGKVILEKVPYFILSLIFGIVAILAQKHGEAIHDISEYPWLYRILFASYGYTMYIVKMIVPVNLSAINTYPDTNGGLSFVYLGFLFPVAAIITLFIISLKKSKIIAFSILFYTLNIFLLLQLLPVGSAIMADRYAYIPSIGFFFLISAGFLWFWNKYPRVKYIYAVILTTFSVFVGIRTYSQCKVWENSITLWNHTLELNPRAVVAWNNRGSAREKMDDKEGAILDFTEAVKIKTDYTHAFYNRGTAKKDLERYKEAIMDFNLALAIDSLFPEAYHNRGIAYENMNMLDSAIADYTKALSIDPQLYKLYTSRGVAKGKKSDMEAAIEDFNRSLAIEPNNPEAYSNRGFAKVNMMKYEEGLKDYNIAIQLNPYSTEALYNRAIARFKLKDTTGSLSDYDSLIEIDPQHIDGLNNRAVVKFHQNNWKAAIADYSRVLAINPDHVDARFNRAKACFNSGDWKKVIEDYDILLEKYYETSIGFYQRGMAKINLGMQNEGCIDLQTAIQIGQRKPKLRIPEAITAFNKYCR